MAMSFKGAHFPQAIIRTGVRWYVAYPLRYRHVEELMIDRRHRPALCSDHSIGVLLQAWRDSSGASRQRAAPHRRVDRLHWTATGHGWPAAGQGTGGDRPGGFRTAPGWRLAHVQPVPEPDPSLDRSGT